MLYYYVFCIYLYIYINIPHVFNVIRYLYIYLYYKASHYIALSRVGRRNLVFHYSVRHFPPNSDGIVCCQRNENINKYKSASRCMCLVYSRVGRGIPHFPPNISRHCVLRGRSFTIFTGVKYSSRFEHMVSISTRYLQAFLR